MSDTIKEFYEDFKERIRNRFVLSFIIIWLYNHWLLVYWIMTCDERYSVFTRVQIISIYLNQQGWLKLFLYPFIGSIIALPAYLVLANFSTWIYVWAGKRLRAHWINKADKGKYELKSLYNREKEKVEELKAKTEEFENSIQKLLITEQELKEKVKNSNEHEIAIQIRYNELQAEHKEVELLNEQMLIPLLHLLAKSQSREVSGLPTSDFLRNDPKMIGGNWKVCDYTNVIDRRSFQELALFINGFEVHTSRDVKFGIIERFSFDRTTSIMKFSIDRGNTVRDEINLIKISNDLLIGMRNNSYVEFKKV